MTERPSGFVPRAFLLSSSADHRRRLPPRAPPPSPRPPADRRPPSEAPDRGGLERSPHPPPPCPRSMLRAPPWSPRSYARGSARPGWGRSSARRAGRASTRDGNTTRIGSRSIDRRSTLGRPTSTGRFRASPAKRSRASGTTLRIRSGSRARRPSIRLPSGGSDRAATLLRSGAALSRAGLDSRVVSPFGSFRRADSRRFSMSAEPASDRSSTRRRTGLEFSGSRRRVTGGW
jgi:hypothetical protein